MAKINLSKAITLTRDDGTALELPAGAQTVDKDVAGHWYVKAHLVNTSATDDGEAENEAKAKADAEAAAKEAAEKEAAENEAKGKEAAKGKTTHGKSTG